MTLLDVDELKPGPARQLRRGDVVVDQPGQVIVIESGSTPDDQAE